MKKIALYTTCNEKYIIHTITCFKSFNDKNLNIFDFYIIGNSFNEKYINILKENNINYIDLNLTEVFKVEKHWPYPSECFWIFKGPDLFYEMGYVFSLSVDSDTYCNRPLDLNWLNNLNLIAGSTKKNKITAKRVILSLTDINKIHIYFKNYNFYDKNIALSAGVLFFNNKKYVENNIFDEIVTLFNVSKENNIERKGDDSLLSLFVYLHDNKNFYYLDKSWNNYFPVSDFKNSYILHGSPIKPWVYNEQPFNEYLNKKWIENKINMINV
jgi:hypothetical protein